MRGGAGTIGADELRAIEDEAIIAAVAGQQEAGIDIITDGEFRRRDFRTGLVDAVEDFCTVMSRHGRDHEGR